MILLFIVIVLAILFAGFILYFLFNLGGGDWSAFWKTILIAIGFVVVYSIVGQITKPSGREAKLMEKLETP